MIFSYYNLQPTYSRTTSTVFHSLLQNINNWLVFALLRPLLIQMRNTILVTTANLRNIFGSPS